MTAACTTTSLHANQLACMLACAEEALSHEYFDELRSPHGDGGLLSGEASDALVAAGGAGGASWLMAEAGCEVRGSSPGCCVLFWVHFVVGAAVFCALAGFVTLADKRTLAAGMHGP